MCISDEIKECYLESRIIFDKFVFVFEKHNMALPIWGMIANKFGSPLHLLTFDTHTDTEPTLSTYKARHFIHRDSDVQYLLKNNKLRLGENFCLEDLFFFAKNYVGNADQIESALDLGYLSSYTVVHRSDDVDDSILYDNQSRNDVSYFHRDDINWDFLNRIIEPLALDFDLDFFHTENEMDFEFEKKIAPLIKRAEVITIALEPECFAENVSEELVFTNDVAFEKLMDIIENTLAPNIEAKSEE